jgi:hypothetical protein
MMVTPRVRLLERLTLLGQLRVLEQFWLVKVHPFKHELQGPRLETPVDPACFDFD